MTKRRTRKQKEAARHNFTLHWEPNLTSDTKSKPEADVNRQISDKAQDEIKKKADYIFTESTDKYHGLASTKKDLIKSVALASLILASEVVLYLIWK